jgi:hypothetical protein
MRGERGRGTIGMRAAIPDVPFPALVPSEVPMSPGISHEDGLVPARVRRRPPSDEAIDAPDVADHDAQPSR